jgi:hypothetical protein
MLVDPRADVPVKAVRRLSITEDPVGENVYLIFSVRDTGCGLTATEMGHLFHRFSQASPKTYKQYGGQYQNCHQTKAFPKTYMTSRFRSRSVY